MNTDTLTDEQRPPVWFTHKRLVLLAGRCARQIAKAGLLTPARADLLAAIEKKPLSQSALVLELGVCHSVVSRLVKALVGLGLAVREKRAEDRRVSYVTITALGIESLAKVRLSFYRVLRMRPHLRPHRTVPSCETVQLAAELALFDDWEPLAKSRSTTLALPSTKPQRTFLRLVQTTVARTVYTIEHFVRSWDEHYRRGSPPSPDAAAAPS